MEAEAQEESETRPRSRGAFLGEGGSGALVFPLLAQKPWPVTGQLVWETEHTRVCLCAHTPSRRSLYSPSRQQAQGVKSQGGWVDLTKFGLSGLHESVGQQWADVGEAWCLEHGCRPDMFV